MKKVLFVYPSVGLGGAPLSLYYTIKNLDMNNVHVKVLFLKQSDASEYFKNNNVEIIIADNYFYKVFYRYFVHTIPNNIRWYQIYRLFRVTLSFILSAFIFAPRILFKEKPDLLYLNSSVLSDFSLAAKICRIKNIVHIREPISDGYHGIRKFLLRKLLNFSASKIIAISIDNSNRIGLPLKTAVIYNFIDYSQNSHFESEIFDKEHLYFLYVGGNRELKGVDIMIDALPLLDKNIKIIFAGYYNNKFTKKEKLIKFFNKNYVPKKIIRYKKITACNNTVVIGFIENVGSYLDHCTGLIFPATLTHFPRPIIEAFAKSKIAISSDLDGINEVIEDNYNGFVFKNKSYAELACKINYVARMNSSERIRIQNNAYKTFLAKFSKENVKKIRKIIEEQLAGTI